MKKTKIFLVEDHELVRKGVRSILSTDASLEIVGEYERATQALASIEAGKEPDIILMDISMPEMNGLEASKLIGEKFPHIQIIILSMHKDEEYIIEGLNFNISGYIVKDSVADEILVAIEKVVNGGKFFSREVIDTAINSYRQIKKVEKRKEELQYTAREVEILNNIAKGMKNAEIAEGLFLSERTVETHRGNLMKKLKAKNMAEMITRGFDLGLIERNPA